MLERLQEGKGTVAGQGPSLTGRDEATDDEIIMAFDALNLIGRSKCFIDCLRLVRKLAEGSVPVLIFGQTGTGKELIARALHYFSTRCDYPFIPVNCGALPEALFENELFGHERGAFTDAHAQSRGLIAQAEGGTLLLDEIDTLSLKAQVVLLRFLQDRHYHPLGSGRPRQANVRIIAATNADLEELVERGLFRQDLLFRIDVMRICLPPLSERGDDLIVLARHFVRRFAASYGQPAPTMTPGFEDWLRTQPWPGNVRELENLMHRAFFFAQDGLIRPETLTATVPDTQAANSHSARSKPMPFNEARARALATFERQYLVRLMRAVGGNVSEAARRAGKERRALGRLLKKHGLERERFVSH